MFVSRSRTQLATIFVRYQLAVGGQIGWSTGIGQGGHLEIHPTSNRKPVQLLDRLQPAHETFGDATKQCVAVVQATGNERLDQRLYGIG